MYMCIYNHIHIFRTYSHIHMSSGEGQMIDGQLGWPENFSGIIPKVISFPDDSWDKMDPIWDLLGFHGISWDFMGFKWISWDFMGFNCTPST